MIKRALPKKKRTAYLLVLIFSTAAAAAALVAFGIIGVQVSRPGQAAAYSTKSEIQYALSFIDDPMYNQASIEFGEGYITKFVDSVKLSFLYGFSAANAADISGSYTATALLEATYNDDDLVWKKDYQIVPPTSFSGEKAVESVSLPLSEYIAFAKAMQQNTGVTTYVKMTVTYTVNASAVVDGKPVSETSESTLIIPITGDVLVMGGLPVNEQSKALESRVLRELLPKKPALIVSIALLMPLAGALICLAVLTKGVLEDPVRRELNTILKKYSGRLVELHPGSLIDACDFISVSAFKDLLLVADEMKKPILKSCGDNHLDTEFYVLSENKVFNFAIAHSDDAPKNAEDSFEAFPDMLQS